MQPFLHGTRDKDTNNWGPRIGFNWANQAGNVTIHGGYGIYYDRITLEVMSLERGLNGTSLPTDVRAANTFYLTSTGMFAPGAPTLSNPFTGFIIPGAGASGINIIDNALQNPELQQFDLGFQWEFAKNWVVRADGIHDLGTHFILGVPIGTVYKPVVGGPDTVKNLESSVNTYYDALFLTVDKRFSNHYQMHAAYTLSKIAELCQRRPDSVRQRAHRSAGPAPRIRTDSQRSAQPLRDLRDGGSEVGLPDFPAVDARFQRADGHYVVRQQHTRAAVPANAGCRVFHNGAQLNAAIAQINANGGEGGTPLPLVDPNATFCNMFNSFDLRLTKQFNFGEHSSLLLIGEVFNLFNTTNILGISNTNYSGYANVLVGDRNVPGMPGYLQSSSFGSPVTTAGGVFGSGGPRAFQLPVRFSF